MVKRAKNFDELSQNRTEWVGYSEKNGFNEGLEKLLTELYPDTAHFVYELLQNAEDANATEVTFKLYNDRLEFIHNGKRLFCLEDIDSITSIAKTTKNSKENNIGKFGVGFKAVFAYTKTPQIHSGDWHFEIRNLVVPIKLEKIDGLDAKKTYFVFPFNNPKKIEANAFNETKTGLAKLPPETILFLNNIDSLTWVIDEEEHHIYKKEHNNIVSLYMDGNDEPISQYLRFTKNNIAIETSNGIINNLSVSLAYKLEKDENNKLKIVSIKQSEQNVFIYFPAEKENSKLRFLINAPFDSEISRASIRNTEDNILLIKEIVKLQIEKMQYLRDNGYLTIDFLGVLPNSKDNLSQTYEAFHSKLVELFKNDNYTPTIKGEFSPANKLYRGSAMYTNGPHISEFIPDNEFAEMLKGDADNNSNITPPLWAKNTLQNSKSDFFLQDLGINKFSVDEFCDWFDDWDNHNKIDIWKKIIERKNFNELIKLYKMFYQYFDEKSDLSSQLTDYPLFYCTDGKIYSLNEKVYIQPIEKIDQKILSSHHFIEQRSFGSTQQEKDKISQLFGNYFGIEEFSVETIEQENFENFCTKYSKDELSKENISISQHIEDIKFLLNYYSTNVDKWSCKYKLENISFIFTTDDRYVSIDKVYSDTRYGNNHDLMTEVKDYIKLHEISDIYRNKLNSKQLEIFIEILTELKIKNTLWIKKVSCKTNPLFFNKLQSNRYNWGWTGIDDDYEIVGLDTILSHIQKMPAEKIRKLIWISLINVPANKLVATYRANQQDNRRTCDAKFVQTLAKEKWILDKNGLLQKPEDISFEELIDNWKRPEENYEHPALKAIGFGKNSQKVRDEQKEKQQAASALGFENEKEAEAARKALDIVEQLGGIEFCQNEICKRKQKTFSDLPISAPKNVERRKEKISQEYENAEDQTYEVRERSVRITDTQVKKDARQYLIDEYTNEDGEMYCQMCKEELPFKKKDGQYYFETKQIFNNMKKEDKHQFLAMCPNCAAEYDEWIRKDEENAAVLLDKIKERKYLNDESVTIDFSIHGDEKSLYFTGKHYLDMRSVVCPNIDNDTNQNFWISLENDSITLQIGDIVRHNSYGEGVVLSIGSNSFGHTATVKFSKDIETINFDYLDKKV